MELKTPQIINSDVLVIGGGGAGLRAAIEVKKHGLDVVLISESRVGFRNNTAISAAGFAAAGIGKKPGDSPEVHLKDTMTAGRFINDQRMIATMTHGAKQQVYDLIGFGVKFRQLDGELLVRQIPGHSYPRNVNVEELRGVNLTRPMRQYAASMGIQFMEGILITKLLPAESAVVGALGIDDKGQMFVIKAKSTILATGGAGQLYLRTNNATVLTGDGYALAYEVGAVLRDMEFVQFYPTTWRKNGNRMCFYERFLPRGAILRNSLGEDILERHGMGGVTLVTRDILTRTIMKELVEGRGIDGHVIFDLTAMPEEKAQELYRSGLARRGEYPDKVPVAPTAHFFMGGMKVSDHGEAGIDGLYAAGEVCGGSHGANRLAGNAITEMLVFGAVAGDRAATRASKISQLPAPGSEITTEIERLTQLASGSGRENLEQLYQSLKQTMWDKVGVIRRKQSLEDARREIAALREQLKAAALTDYRQLLPAIKLANMLTIAEMVCRAALTRTESRGAHYRTDYPEEDDRQWLKTIEICCQGGEMRLRVAPVNGDK